ncbi:Serpentine Receptor, class E (Epsilon) [Caenorhabditis elegans]|nr:Serpentine Receptor, class E (Epsilon) [Caenorhabditis elegans]CAA99958.2 Serpentine Receptor, class E (Epsilon) [Caenorhabditis elegans]|eukprot:NP_001256460.1 Serpentine Receptor, class E (epsilon) [Caenorhabditis elegans]
MSMTENIMYIIIVLIASIATILCLLIVGRSNTFHPNLQGPIWFTAFVYFDLTISKMLTIVFQTTYLVEQNVPEGGMTMILWTAATHYHFLFTVMAAPIVIVVERSLATYFVFDYEKKKRRYILVLLLLFQNFFGATFTLLTVNNILRYISAAVLAGIIAISSFLTFLYNCRINKRTLHFVETRNRDIKFDLSVRYQLRENVKTFKMLNFLLLMLTGMIVLLAILKTIPMIIGVEEKTKYMFKMSTDMIVHAGPIYVTITLICAVEDYRIIFYRFLGYEKKKVDPCKINSKQTERDIYFEQFLKVLK